MDGNQNLSIWKWRIRYLITLPVRKTILGTPSPSSRYLHWWYSYQQAGRPTLARTGPNRWKQSRRRSDTDQETVSSWWNQGSGQHPDAKQSSPKHTNSYGFWHDPGKCIWYCGSGLFPLLKKIIPENANPMKDELSARLSLCYFNLRFSTLRGRGFTGGNPIPQPTLNKRCQLFLHGEI